MDRPLYNRFFLRGQANPNRPRRTGATTSEHGKVCVIGLDGGTFSVLDKWMESGDMPHLAGLQARGAQAELISTMPPVTGPAWTSMTTGVNPGQHGIYDFVKWGPDGVSSRLVQSGDCTAPRLWDIIGQQDRGVGVFGVPLTYPARPVNGFLVTGFLTPSDGCGMAYPGSLCDELKESDLARPEPSGLGRSPVEHASSMVQAHARRDHVMRSLLERSSPDFFMFVASELDHLQHAFWPYCARTDGATDPAVAKAVREMFVGLDDTVGFLTECFGPDATYFVVSDHGFGPLRGSFRLNKYLARQGFLALRPGSWSLGLRRGSAVQYAKAALARVGLLDCARAALRRLARMGIVRPQHPDMASAARALVADWREMLTNAIDWERTVAIVMSRSDCGVHVNLRGRNARGVVEPGRQYEEVVGSVIRALQQLRDPETGRKLVSHLARGEDVQSGPYVGEGPDIFVGLDGGSVAVDESLVGPLFADVWWTGNHAMEGILVVAGPGIRHGCYEPADILDVAPTMLHALGLPVPSYMEGRALSNMYAPNALAQRPVAYVEAELEESRLSAEPSPLGAADERLLRRQLEQLGYM
jgi:predicted AlkP superfamily phosphohydrolase/phosphomutase